ncbi:5,10-methenyltetrahydrofolate synthetase [Thioflavicoccus mobilis 8321]|uniref:5-formyltetrahydrofolate cyclo-ligase n=1 Tax=Thioflavicoccus mobilis 8321 TaxID=765912 RepID=L0GXH7_9GAMM|nr:5-formyltetrahydrofolate cyclo-ligase [Thioflavicoccus mobilis]AGA89989.1 5,10-methenyltetrahydrofolate synthetase [Thioflavicoccus mobilis 8321]
MPSCPTPRGRLRALRRSLPPAVQRQHARDLARHLGRSPRLRRARRVALYWPSDGELDPRLLLKLVPRKQWHLPVLCRFPHRSLMFVRWRPGERLRPNRFAIPEPTRRGRRIHSAGDLDLVLMPVVGFDADGNRLGMGCGYYDRTLSRLRQRQAWHRPRLIGLAHSCQRVAQIEPNPWDVRLDAIATEAGIIGKL